MPSPPTIGNSSWMIDAVGGGGCVGGAAMRSFSDGTAGGYSRGGRWKVSASGAVTRPVGTTERLPLDLDDDRQHHRAAPEPLVDERRDVVVQEALEHLDLGHPLLGRAVQRVLDRLAQLVDERALVLEERHAAREHLGRD